MSVSPHYPVTIYTLNDYAGSTGSLPYGRYPSMDRTGIPNDSMNSIKVAAFTTVILYFDPNFQGRATLLVGPVNIPSFGVYQGQISNAISSLIVTRNEPTMDTKLKCCQGSLPDYSCGEYVPGSSMCSSNTATYCSTHMGDPYCQSWCRSNTILCDKPVTDYCAINPNDPYCSCVNSIASKANIANPKCVDIKCLDTGYLTTSMANTNCPSIVTCDIVVQMQNAGIILSNKIPIQQNCGANSTSSVKTIGPGGGTTTTTSGSGGNTTTSTGGGSGISGNDRGANGGSIGNIGDLPKILGSFNGKTIMELILVLILFIIIAIFLVIGVVKLTSRTSSNY